MKGGYENRNPDFCNACYWEEKEHQHPYFMCPNWQKSMQEYYSKLKAEQRPENPAQNGSPNATSSSSTVARPQH